MKIFVEMDDVEYQEFKVFKNRMPERELYDPDDIKRSIIRNINRLKADRVREKYFNQRTGEDTIVEITSFEFGKYKVAMKEIIKEKDYGQKST